MVSMRCVVETEFLGVPIATGGRRPTPPPQDMRPLARGGESVAEAAEDPLLRLLRRALRGLAGLKGLSIFGRAFCSSGYAATKFFHRMEFMALPAATVLERLQQRLAAYAERGQVVLRTDASLAWNLLGGRPRDGGFGALPVANHVRARHARWGARLVGTAPGKKP